MARVARQSKIVGKFPYIEIALETIAELYQLSFELLNKKPQEDFSEMSTALQLKDIEVGGMEIPHCRSRGEKLAG
jgi:hypothetical protein